MQTADVAVVEEQLKVRERGKIQVNIRMKKKSFSLNSVIASQTKTKRMGNKNGHKSA